MGFLDNFKRLSQISIPKEWKVLKSSSDLDQLNALSKHEALIIFKHSTSCGISNSILRRFESEWEAADLKLSVFFLDLLSYRETSNFIADTYKVTHQSPQIIMIVDGQATYHASHGAIKYSTAVGKLKK